MKFLPIFLSLLSTAAFTVASPIAGDPPTPVAAIVAPFVAAVVELIAAPLAVLGPAKPVDTTPIPEGYARCAVIGDKNVWSDPCGGGPGCAAPKDRVKEYKPGDLIEFKCYMAGYAGPLDTPKAWVRIQQPWGYFPRDSLDQECALKIKEVCPEGKDI